MMFVRVFGHKYVNTILIADPCLCIIILLYTGYLTNVETSCTSCLTVYTYNEILFRRNKKVCKCAINDTCQFLHTNGVYSLTKNDYLP